MPKRSTVGVWSEMQRPLAGMHQGRDAAFSVLASRKLVTIEDVLVGDSLGARPLDEGQRFIDDMWSQS